MTIDEIINYISNTPENSNPTVLKDMLLQLSNNSEGGNNVDNTFIIHMGINWSDATNKMEVISVEETEEQILEALQAHKEFKLYYSYYEDSFNNNNYNIAFNEYVQYNSSSDYYISFSTKVSMYTEYEQGSFSVLGIDYQYGEWSINNVTLNGVYSNLNFSRQFQAYATLTTNNNTATLSVRPWPQLPSPPSGSKYNLNYRTINSLNSASANVEITNNSFIFTNVSNVNVGDTILLVLTISNLSQVVFYALATVLEQQQ